MSEHAVAGLACATIRFHSVVTICSMQWACVVHGMSCEDCKWGLVSKMWRSTFQDDRYCRLQTLLYTSSTVSRHILMFVGGGGAL